MQLQVHRGFMSYRCIVYAVTGALRFYVVTGALYMQLQVHRGFMSYRCIVYAVTGTLRFYVVTGA